MLKNFYKMLIALKKKKNIMFVTFCVVISFILYQLYFFLTITSETANNNKVVPVLDDSHLKKVVHLRSEADKNINENGIIRGVLYSNMPQYRPDGNKEFKCLDSEQRVPFECVNDDYCDCDDATDEPSTSACVNGTFYCDMQYQNKPVSYNSIPSSKVNDGICDCCDGSDEWQNKPDQRVLTRISSSMYRHYANKCSNVCYN